MENHKLKLVNTHPRTTTHTRATTHTLHTRATTHFHTEQKSVMRQMW
jgi:hypothetical protein